jgi:replicative DNA helicase
VGLFVGPTRDGYAHAEPWHGRTADGAQSGLKRHWDGMAALKHFDSPHAATREAISAAIFDRQPPRSLDAERGVLGSILLLPEVCDDVALVIRADDFYDTAHQKLFAHLLRMHEDGGRIDSTLLVEHLKSAGDLEIVGGVAMIIELMRAVPTAAHAVFYASVVREKATLRSLIHTSTEILRDAYEDTSDPREMLARAEQKIFAILDSQTSNRVASISDILHQAMDRIDARMKQEHAIGGIETGFTDFDQLTGGLHNSELIILAARPSMGKTALALNIAEHVTLHKQVGTLFVSLEMSSIELADRMLCSLAEVNGKRLRNGTISNDDRRRIVEKAAELDRAPLFVDDSPSRTMTEIAAAARRLKRKNNLGLVVIDYLQLIEPDNFKDPRQEQVARIARRLKGLARELSVPVLCLAQLNRQAEVSKENRPRLSHLRESGAIEQDADVVMFVHREEYFQTNDEDRERCAGQADIIVAKQRNGPIGDVKLTWKKDFTRFANAMQRPYDEFEQFNSESF